MLRTTVFAAALAISSGASAATYQLDATSLNYGQWSDFWLTFDDLDGDWL